MMYILHFSLLVRNTNRKRNSKSLATLNGQNETQLAMHRLTGPGNVVVPILSYRFLHSAIGYDSHLHEHNSVATFKLQGR